MTEKHSCSKNVRWGSWGRSSPCSRKGVVFEEGAWWCKQHSPTATETRETERRERREALAKSSAANSRARHVARQWAEVGPELLAELVIARATLKEVCEDCYGSYHAREWLDDAIKEAEEIK